MELSSLNFDTDKLILLHLASITKLAKIDAEMDRLHRIHYTRISSASRVYHCFHLVLLFHTIGISYPSNHCRRLHPPTV